MKQNSWVIPSFKWLTAIVTIVFIVFSLYGGSAFAHAKLVKSDPPHRATLNAAPKQIQLWFNEEIEGNFASISLLDAGGESVTEKNPELVSDDLKSVVLPLPGIVPGRYTVKFRVLSKDGHVVESEYSFTVKNTEK